MTDQPSPGRLFGNSSTIPLREGKLRQVTSSSVIRNRKKELLGHWRPRQRIPEPRSPETMTRDATDTGVDMSPAHPVRALIARLGAMTLETFAREGDALEFYVGWAPRSLYLAPDARQADALARSGIARQRILLADELAMLFDGPPSSPLNVMNVVRSQLEGTVFAVILLPRASDPWPDAVPGLGARRSGLFDPCRDCGAGSWERYGRRVLCLQCAQARERGTVQ